MSCEFQRFHYKEVDKFNKCFIYGDIRIGVVLFNVRNELYYCVDILNLQNHQHMHMDRFIFEKCIERLSELIKPNISRPYVIQNDEFIIKQIPFTNAYKAIYGNQRMVFDTHAIEGITDIWKRINISWDRDEIFV